MQRWVCWGGTTWVIKGRDRMCGLEKADLVKERAITLIDESNIVNAEDLYHCQMVQIRGTAATVLNAAIKTRDL